MDRGIRYITHSPNSKIYYVKKKYLTELFFCYMISKVVG